MGRRDQHRSELRALAALDRPTYLLEHSGMRSLLSRLVDPSLSPRTLRLEPELMRRAFCGCG